MPEGIATRQGLAVFKDLGCLEYSQALRVQMAHLESKIQNRDLPDVILRVEHPSVFTFGKNGGAENLIVTKSFLDSKKIDVIQTGRGGNITYHCPGQAIMYPIVDLEKNRIGVENFVHHLEEIMRLTALDFGVHAERNPKNHGIWVNNKKIGSVGIGIKKGISFHGLALNINPDVTPFSWINPCGLAGVSMTSIQKESGTVQAVSVTKANECFKKHFCSVFNFLEI